MEDKILEILRLLGTLPIETREAFIKEYLALLQREVTHEEHRAAV